ncbi:EamA family transporter [Zoogloea sp.]|uniref:DMT family transporter n=1 Tax=Zoogloea sp. TaxID=49181 RepID=UPI001AD1C05B|nr:EamA family transporter [Zoogloea sp.]MBN8282375.1 EamA family transporter [Zoogloea sp.]
MQSLWMIVASLLFACMGVCVKLGSARYTTGELVFYRGLVGFVMMFGLLRLQALSCATPHWRLQLSRGVSGTIALMCYFFALGILPLATAVTLNYTSPLFVALLLACWFRERVGKHLFAAVALGFIGVVLLLQPTLDPAQWAGALGGLGSGLIASLAYLNVRELGRLGEPEARTVLWFSLITAACGLPWALASGSANTVSLKDAAILLGVGGFGGCAQLAMTRAYRYGKTIVSANLAYTTVIFSSLFGVALWDERLPWTSILAILIIIASGVWVSMASRKPTAALESD